MGSHHHESTEHHNHSHEEDHEHSLMDDPHTKSVIYGLMSLAGIVGFLIIERCIAIISDLCSQNSRKSAKVRN